MAERKKKPPPRSAAAKGMGEREKRRGKALNLFKRDQARIESALEFLTGFESMRDLDKFRQSEKFRRDNEGRKHLKMLLEKGKI